MAGNQNFFSISLTTLHIRKALQTQPHSKNISQDFPAQDCTTTPRILSTLNVFWRSEKQQWLGKHLQEAAHLLHCFNNVIAMYRKQAHTGNRAKESGLGLCLTSALACSLLRDRKISTLKLQLFNSPICF